MKRVNFAFTLAEVLITLGIIGIVAALTIPTLMNSINEQSNRTALKNFYSIISNATNQIMAENGGIIKGLFSTNNDLIVLYRDKLSFIKECTNGSVDGNCWAPSWKTLSNGTGWSMDAFGASGVILKDGMNMVFDNADSTCTRNESGAGAKECFSVKVDVNGNKAPNKMGYDIFRFYIDYDKVLPFGMSDQANNLSSYPCNKTSRGDSCAAYILQDINYVIPDS